MCGEFLKGGPPTGHGADVTFTLPLRGPLDPAKLQWNRVSLGGGATVGACPHGDSQDCCGVGCVWKTVGVPPPGAAFALKEGGARGLVACTQVAGVAGVRDVVGVEFRVIDFVESSE